MLNPFRNVWPVFFPNEQAAASEAVSVYHKGEEEEEGEGEKEGFLRVFRTTATVPPCLHEIPSTAQL